MQKENLDPSKPNALPNPSAAGGPRTEAGRATSSRNATKHGCCSTETLFLASESQEEFKSLESAWIRTYEPKAAAEVHLVQQLVEADWFLQRSTRTAAEVEAQLFTTTPTPPNGPKLSRKCWPASCAIKPPATTLSSNARKPWKTIARTELPN